MNFQLHISAVFQKVFEPTGQPTRKVCNTRVLSAIYGPHKVRGSTKSKQTVHDKAVINFQYSQAMFRTCSRKQRARGDFRALKVTSMVRHRRKHTHILKSTSTWKYCSQMCGGVLKRGLN